LTASFVVSLSALLCAFHLPAMVVLTTQSISKSNYFGKPLPSTEEFGLNDPEGLSIWRFILETEAAAKEGPAAKASKYQNSLVGIRVLGFLLKDLFVHQGAPLGSKPYLRLRQEASSCLSTRPAVGERRTQADQNTAQYPVGSLEEMSQIQQNLIKLGLLYRNYVFRVCVYSYRLLSISFR
jgi:hypothetical protein